MTNVLLLFFLRMIERREKKKKILVGLSGGVDSFMAAHYLGRAGWQVLGGYLEMQKNSQKLKEARMSAKKLGIKMEVIDCKEEFQKEVADFFVKSYQKGRTPNPCVFCNPQIKFKFLLNLARKKKISSVATGHYANIGFLQKYKKIQKYKNMEEVVKAKKVYVLKKGLDESKDQSYFLYRLKQTQLKRILFPLGEKNKSEIKVQAQRLGFYQNQINKESQDICFFGEGEDLSVFLKDKIKSWPGKIINEKGAFLGQHQGLEKYTLGQRRGIEISGGPFFVIEKNFKNNTLKVSKDKNHPLLWRKEIFLEKVSWIGDKPEERKSYFIKIRYGKNGSPGKIFQVSKRGKWKVVLKEKQWAPAVGQSVVIYDKDQVIGGGVICQK